MANIDVSVETDDKPAPPPDHPNTCPSCHSHYRDDELERALWVCAQCGHHFPMRARARIASLTDAGTFFEEAADLHSEDPLAFFDLRPYTERLAEAEMKTGLADAMVIGQAALDGRGCELAVMDFAFMGGSMGSVVGEKFSRACDSAAERGVPLISVTSSGGARMQEGILALMQLPKTVAAVEDLHDAGQALISVMAHPTTGGVLASFATLGDVLLAEPGALMSFAGPRVVQQLTREKLPEDFGLAEQNYRFGNIDAIVPRPELKPIVARLLKLFDAPAANGAV
ncbi:MAG TPA: acetyl-CoA carboxylase carboxyltransferase subunit beta [Gaiellaceae bacterium]|nr:acetyl-CoA carboxylase carboxyltransferase subunit beta [Gaiellaceae bacterium]